jgi:DNA-binding beta-propeller fold protein YncE
MKIRSWAVYGLVLATSGLLVGQQSQIAGPVAGFVFDSPGRVLRPIQGVPGAALVGDPVSFGLALAAVYVSPRQDSALVVGADASLHLFRLNAGAVSEISLGGLSGVPQSVAFSPSGTAVALFAMGRARVLTGLPNGPSLMGTVTVPGPGEEMVRASVGRRPSPAATRSQALAISDDGTYLLTVSGGSVRLLSIHGENRSLLPAQANAFVAFAAGGHDAAVMDSASGLTLIRDAAGAASPQVLAIPDAGLAGPAGLAFSQDQQTLYVASATAQSVAAFNLAAGSRTAIGCDCTPATLVPMGNLFRLNDLGPAPLWLLDGAGSNPRTVFVPARAD